MFGHVVPVGSTVTCNPPPQGTDRDYLCRGSKLVFDKLKALGFETTTDEEYQGMPSQFTSFRREDVNLIVTDDGDFYNAFLSATCIAKRLNLLKKADRIALFQSVLYRTIDDAFLPQAEEGR